MVQHADIDHSGITGVGGSITVENEGTPLATAATTLDFVGAGVTASGTGAEKTITIPGISVAVIADHKAQNTAGGTFTSGAWQTRVLQTEVSDANGLVTISSNQFTPISGTYLIRASAPAYGVDNHQTRLQNITAASTTLTGTTEYSRSTASAQNQTRSFVVGVFTANGTDAYELQHRCGTTKSTDGMGTQANLTTEVYAQVELAKIG